MSKYYLTMKDFHGVNDAYKLEVSKFHDRTGKNIGNLVFRKGLASIIADLASYQRISFEDLGKNKLIYETAEVVVVSCANWLGTSAMHEKSNKARADLIDKFTCPVICFGIGIQAPDGQDDICFGPETLRLAKILSKKSQLISCRCELTVATLKKHGIHNAYVTGCPSNFINLDLTKERFRQVPLQRTSSKNMSCLISEVTHGNASSVKFIRHAFDVLLETPSKYVLQVAPLLNVIYNKSSVVPSDYLTAFPSLAPRRLINLIKDKTLAFSSVDEWLFAARRFDFSYGMRMHGSMVPLQAGVPTVIITHDQRTKELAQVMSLPRIHIDTFLAQDGHPITIAYEHFWASLDDYLQQRLKLASTFVDFLKKNNLTPSPKFESYSQANVTLVK